MRLKQWAGRDVDSQTFWFSALNFLLRLNLKEAKNGLLVWRTLKEGKLICFL